jgi:hypothetical protein
MHDQTLSVYLLVFMQMLCIVVAAVGSFFLSLGEKGGLFIVLRS